MKKKMMVKENEFNCTVMECKTIEGHGSTIDCILIDGVIKRGNYIFINNSNLNIKSFKINRGYYYHFRFQWSNYD